MFGGGVRISYIETLQLTMEEVPELLDWAMESIDRERKAAFGRR